MQIAKNATLLFKLRVRTDKKVSKNGFIVYGRLTVRGVRREFSTEMRTAKNEWNDGKFTGKDAFSKNGELHEITKRLTEICLRFELNKKRYTAQQVMKLYRNDDDSEIADYHFIEKCYKKYLEFQEKRLHTGEISEGSYNRLEMLNRNYFSEFWKEQNVELLGEIRKFHFKELILWMQHDKELSRNYVRKAVSYYRAFFDFCVEREWIENSPFKYGKLPPKEKKKIEYLPIDEVKILEDYSFASNPLEKSKDAFLFCCFTGLAYVDYHKLSSEYVSKEEDGREWITLQRSKGESKDYGYTKVPILEGAKRLIEKYEGIDNLPKMTNQRFNLYLKEVGNILDLSIELRFHTARKTFAMIALNEWQLPVEVVAKLLGHSSPKTTLEAYAFVQDNTVVNAMSGIM